MFVIFFKAGHSVRFKLFSVRQASHVYWETNTKCRFFLISWQVLIVIIMIFRIWRRLVS
jgi:hypothetical protein